MESGSFDLQVNGYGGVDFNSADLTGEQLHSACELLQQHQVAGILATVVTDQIPAMCAFLQNLVRLHRPIHSPGKLSPESISKAPF